MIILKLSRDEVIPASVDTDLFCLQRASQRNKGIKKGVNQASFSGDSWSNRLSLLKGSSFSGNSIWARAPTIYSILESIALNGNKKMSLIQYQFVRHSYYFSSLFSYHYNIINLETAFNYATSIDWAYRVILAYLGSELALWCEFFPCYFFIAFTDHSIYCDGSMSFVMRPAYLPIGLQVSLRSPPPLTWTLLWYPLSVLTERAQSYSTIFLFK